MNHYPTLTKLIVVEAFTPCTCHTAVTARCQDRPFFVFFNVSSPRDVNFGDTILVNGTCEEGGSIGPAYLYRGPELFYHLVIDDFNPELLGKLLIERTELTQEIYNEERDN